MSGNYYTFEYGSGSTWGSYLVPADGYRLWVNSDRKVCLSSVFPASTYFSGVRLLQPMGSTQFCETVRALLNAREAK